jgi:hypothetical protein
MAAGVKWLLLLYGLPSTRSAERVSFWRRLKKFGAIQIKSSAYVLPDTAANLERFQWLASEVRDSGGEATLIQAGRIEGLSDEKMIGLFNEDRARDYRELIDGLNAFIARHGKKKSSDFEGELDRLKRRIQKVKDIDFYSCPIAQDADMLSQRADRLLQKRQLKGAKLDAKRFQGKTWLTRQRPEIDRVGSAWLIQRFIDPKAKFVFGPRPQDALDAIPYDMSDVEFTHQGEDCTFETLIRRFGIEDKAVRIIGEMIHDADLEDDKFERVEAIGIDRALKGWARLGLRDEQLLEKGSECFDALYEYVRK